MSKVIFFILVLISFRISVIAQYNLEKTLTCTPPITANITPPGPIYFCAGDSVNLTASTTASLDPIGYSYEWFKNNVSVYGPSLSTIYKVKIENGDEYGNYKVRVHKNVIPEFQPCYRDSYSISILDCGVLNQTQIVSNNPDNLGEHFKEGNSIDIFNIQGSHILNADKHENLETLPSGIYLAIIQNKDQIIRFRFVIQK